MNRYFWILLVLGAFCVLGVTLFRPGPAERLEAEVARLSPEEGLVRLDAARSHQEFTQNLDLLHARLNMAAGRLDRARALLTELKEGSELPPATVLDDLAEIAVLEGRMTQAEDYLRAAYDAEPTAARRQVLTLRYRSLRDKPREIELLRSVGVESLGLGERQRLAELLAATGDLDGYEAVNRTAASMGGEAALPFQAALLSYLIETNRGDAAVADALSWLSAELDRAQVARTALATLLDRGARDEAAAFAFTAIRRDPDLGGRMAMIFAVRGYGPLARAVQSEWLSCDREISEADWDALVAFAEMTGDVYRLFRAMIDHPETQPPAEGYMVLLRYRGAAALLPVLDRIGPDLVRDRPLLGAAIAANGGRHDTVRDLLLAAAGTDMSDWDKDLWTHLSGTLVGTVMHLELATDPALPAEYRRRVRDVLKGPVFSLGRHRAVPEETGG